MKRDGDQYGEQFARQLPPGRVWPKEPGSRLRGLLRGLAEGFARAHARALDLIEEVDPRTTTQLLLDWERVLGLPEDCPGAETTLAGRRAAVVSKLTSLGGQSPGYFIAVAASLGFTITIREYGPAQIQDPVGVPVYSPEWRHTWEVNAPEFTIRIARVNESQIGEPLRAWGNELLECVFARLKPAQSRLVHTYGS